MRMQRELECGAGVYHRKKKGWWAATFSIMQHVGDVAVPAYLHNNSWCAKKCSSRAVAVVVANATAAGVAANLANSLPCPDDAAAAHAAAASNPLSAAAGAAAEGSAAAGVGVSSAGTASSADTAGAVFVLTPESKQALVQFAADCTASQQAALSLLSDAEAAEAAGRIDKAMHSVKQRVLTAVNEVRVLIGSWD